MTSKVYKMRANDPNVLMNKLIFPESKVCNEIIEKICPKDIYRQQLAIDFNLLIPQPNCLYRGLKDGSNDFLHHSDWNLRNWGSCHNAFNGTVEKINNSIIVYFEIEFDSTISILVPYPIIVAIANLVGEQFTYLYYTRNEYAWGVERYGIKGTCTTICISRLEKRLNAKEDLLELRKEFLTTDELIEIFAKERCKKCKKKEKK